MFIKKQNEAQASAKTLIDFSNVMDSEVHDGGDNNEEVIVFDIKNIENRQHKQSFKQS